MTVRFVVIICTFTFLLACAKKHHGSTVPEPSQNSGRSYGPVTPTQYQTLDVGSLVNNAFASGQSSVTIPAGTWPVQPPDADAGIHLRFENFKDFTINAAGAQAFAEFQEN